jgi:hypothetical protein
VFTQNTKAILSVLALSMLVIFAGCSDDDDPINPGGPEMGDGAMLRVVHASPNAPAVDIYAKGVSTPIWSGAAYTQTTDYKSLAAGNYVIQLRGAGAEATDPPAFETDEITVPEGATITAIAVGNFGSTSDSDEFRILLAVENFSAPGANSAAVRIIHGSPDAPTVGLDLGDDGTADVSDFKRFDDTGEAGVPLPSGQALQIGILAGTARVTAFTTPQLPDGANLFVIATGFLSQKARDDEGFGLLAVGPAGTVGLIRQNPVVYALHAGPDAPPVDIYAGSAKLVDNLSFGEIAAPVQVPPGSYTLAFRATGSTADAATATTPALAAGEVYLATASGFLADNSFGLVYAAEQFGLNPAPLVRVVHAAQDAPAVDVGTVDGLGELTPVSDYTNLGYGESSRSEGTGLPVGGLLIGVAGTGSTTPAATFNVTTANGISVFAVAAGAFQTPSPNTFRLLVVDTGASQWTVSTINPN